MSVRWIAFTVVFSCASVVAPGGANSAEGKPRKPAAVTGAGELPPRPARLAAGQRRGKLKWKFDLGARHRLMGPVPGEQLLFVGNVRSALVAVDRASGALKWRREMYPTGLTYAKGTVYMVDEKGYVRALAAATGATRWEFKTGGGGAGAPIVKDGIVYAISNYLNRKTGIWSGYLWVLDARGEEQARFVSEGASFPGPIIAGRGVVFVTIARRSGRTIVGVAAGTGEARWKPARLGDGTLIGYAQGRLLVDTKVDSSFVAFAPARSDTVLWRHGTGRTWRGQPATSGGLVFGPIFERRSRKVGAAYLVARELASGKERWRIEMKDWKMNMSPSAAKGAVCVGTVDKYLHVIDTKRGRIKWVFAPPRKVERSYVRALDCKIAGDTVLAWDDRGHLFALDRETGRLRWASALPRGVRNPILRGDTVYAIGADGFLYAVH